MTYSNRIVWGLFALLVCLSSQLAAQVITENAVIEAGDTLLEGQEVVVDGATLTLDGSHRFQSLRLINGARLTHSAAAANTLAITVDGSVVIDQGAAIDLNSRGRAKPSGLNNYVGGSHGGRGGFYGNSESADEYGNYGAPVDLGSGADDVRGGGAIHLVAQSLVLNGSIFANGESNTSSGGAGSGGSIWIDVNELAGAGVITANGGNARSGYTGSGGGGGRVAIHYGTNLGFDFSAVKTLGGVKGASSSTASGNAGTTYLADKTSQQKQLLIIGQDRQSQQTDLPDELGSGISIFASKAHLRVLPENLPLGAHLDSDGAYIVMDGAIALASMNLRNGSVLTHPTSVENKLDISVQGSVEIDETSSINVSGRGSVKASGQHSYAGGSYGGRGGYYGGEASPEEFGSYTAPFDYGIGADDLRGGGAVRLAANELVLNGSIQANGSSNGSHGGAGSGGSVWLRVNQLSGAGKVSADGGSARSGYSGSGGGGGRVAVQYLDRNEYDASQVTATGGAGGSGSSSRPGADGSIYWGQSQLPTKIIASAPSMGETVRSDLATIKVEFLSTVDLSTFSAADVELVGPSGVIEVVGLETLDNRTFTITLPSPLTQEGLYALSIGPSIKGTTGLPMDQNDNGVGGESEADRFNASFSVAVADIVVEEDLFIAESDPTYQDKIIVVDKGTVTVDGNYQFKALQLKPGTKLTGVRSPSSSRPRPTWKFESLVVEEGAMVDLSGLGLPPSELVSLRAGGSFGGLGTSVAGGNTNPVFGNRFEPLSYGDGGRGITDDLVSYGGGALQLLTDELILKGDINANGGAAPYERGGASGGSIWIETDVLRGHGRISADGSIGSVAGANGGGGRISLTYKNIEDFDPVSQLSVSSANSVSSGSVYVHRSHHATRVRDVHLNPIHPDPRGTLTIEFSEPLDMNTFQTSDIELEDETGQVFPILGVRQISDHVYEIDSFEMLPNGKYRLIVGPEIASTSGFGMDQDLDGVIGEPEEDVFVFDFEIFAADEIITSDIAINPDDTRFKNKRILVDGGKALLAGTYEFDSLRIAHNGQVVAADSPMDSPSQVVLSIDNEFVVDEGSVVSVSGNGYGPTAGQPTYVGGSHGGFGGSYGESEALATYGDLLAPQAAGQGGKYSSETYWSKGGGALKIQAGSATINGSLQANGDSGHYSSSPGGAGGSIWLIAQSLTVGANGQVEANGGHSQNRGTGGGGRVAVYYESLSGKALDSTLVARDGTGSTAYSGSAGTVYWEDTVSGHSVLRLDNKNDRSGAWLELDQLPEGLDELHLIGGRMKLSVESVPDVLVIDNADVELTVPQIQSLVINNGSSVVLAADRVVDLSVSGSTVTQASAMEVAELRLNENSVWHQSGNELTITDLYDFQQSDFVQNGVWNRPEGNNSLTVSGYELALFGEHTFDRLEVGNGGSITTRQYDKQIPQSGTLDLTVNELIVADGAKLSANGSGYGPAEGQPRYAGGSHGGEGGTYSSYEALPTYGDERSPVTLGQGGKHAGETFWSKGGGALKIQAGSAVINGSLQANGDSGYFSSSAGGAGGSIWVLAQSLTIGAEAKIAANGGYSRNVGTGGGGRIAIYYATAFTESFETVVTANAGTGSSYRGAAGTIIIEQQQSPTAVRNVSLNAINNLELSGFDVWFTNAIASESLSVEDITLNGPNGSVSVADISQIDPVHFHIELNENLPDGTYQLYVGPEIQSQDGFGMDQNGNGIVGEQADVYSFDFIVDTRPPEPVALTSHQLGNSYELDKRAVSLAGVRSDSAAIWINGTQYASFGTGPWQINDFRLTEGDNSVVLIAVDEAGNHSQAVSIEINVDSIAPSKTDQSPSSYINAAPQQIRVSGRDEGSGLALEGAQVIVQRDGVNIAGSLSLNGNDYLFTPSGSLLEGSYTVQSRLADSRGNVSGTYSQTFTLDVTKPQPPVLVDYPETTSQSSYTFEGSKEAHATLLLGGNPLDINEASTSWTFTADLSSGDNAFQFTQRDRAGNLSDPTNAQITFDDSAPGPVVPVIFEEGNGKTIELDWSAYDEVANGNDIRHYRVYVQTIAFNTVSAIAPYAYVPPGIQRLTVSDLQRDTPVYVAIVAEDKTGLMLQSVPSAEVTPVDVEPPENPASLSVTPSSTALRLDWPPSADSGGDLAGYRVSVNRGDRVDTYSVEKDAAVSEGGRITYTVDSLSPASTYPLTVTAYDQHDNESSGVTNPGVTLLANPQNLTSEAFSGKVTLNWSSSEPTDLVGKYHVYASDGAFTTVAGMQPRTSTDPATLTTSIAGLENGTTYYVAVTAVNLSGGEEKQVTPVEVVPVEDEEGPEITRITYFDGDSETELSEGEVIRRNGVVRVYAEDPSGLGRLEMSANGQPLGDDFTATPAFEVPWNLVDIDDGSYQLTGRVFDTLNNSTDMSVALEVSLNPPGAPTITAPVSGSTTNQSDIEIKGQSGRSTAVRLSINGVPQTDTVAANAQGQFTARAALVEGENQVTVESRYVNRDVFGATGTPVTITLDRTAPDAPAGFTATSKPLGQIALSWSSVENAAGYHVYRADYPFADVREAFRITDQLLGGTSYQDLPETDGNYYYRVVAINDLGTESKPSSQVSAEADSEAPYALEIRLAPQGRQDSMSGRTGPGPVDVEVIFNEPLKTKPYLAYTVSGGTPMVAELNRDYSENTRYTGSFVIKESSVSGTAMAVMSAHDEVGNRGTEVKAGDTFIVDTKGPEVANLQINPSAPINNDPDESGQGREVEVILTLADDVNPGEMPVLIPFISNAEQAEIIPDVASGITLALDGSSTPGMPVYAGRFRLPVSAGQDDSGQPAAEQLGFHYSATDDLGNAVDSIAGDPRFQVYQGDLPPLDAPVGLVARALPGGQVQLNWNPVEGASGYVIYRQAPREAELTELKDLSFPETAEYVDGSSLRLEDGVYQYAVASVRNQNGQSSESGLSNVVEVTADGTPPGAPENLSLELNGNGVIARWQPPGSETQDGLLRYNLYRLDLPEGTVLSDVDGYTPLQNAIPEIIALDSRPSVTEHLYVVTAVDSAGNESIPSVSGYLNVDLLPVSDFRISLGHEGRPSLLWDHAKASSVGFDVYDITSGQPRQLNAEQLTTTSYEDLDYNSGAPVSGAPNDRLYRVVAVDSNDVASVGHDLLLPALSVSLVDDPSGAQLDRGVMNRVMFRISNAGQSTVVQARLKVGLLDDRTVREHMSQRFTVSPGGYTDVPVVIGGYDTLPTLASMDLQIILEPRPGQQVAIEQQQDIQVGQSALIASLEAESFVRGGTGKARLVIENPSDVETEILTATAKGQKDSTEIRLVLKDKDGNVLSSQAIRQVTGDVVSLNNGETVARIPASGTYRSQPFDVAVPSTAPDDVRVHLEIDRFRFHSGRDTFVAIEGTRASAAVSLEETPYFGEVTEISPETGFTGEPVTISGRAIDRETQAPLANVPLTLVLTSRGFERTFPVYSGADGSVEYQFTPGNAESGSYRVSLLHPDMVERPEQGSFTIEGAGVSPTRARLTIPRNYDYDLKIKVTAGHATELQNARLVYAPATDAEGQPLPAPQGLSFDLGAVTNISANKTAYLNLTLAGDATAPENGTVRFHVVADNREEPLDTVSVEYFLTEARPLLLPQPTLVNTGVGLDQSQQESIQLENTGLETAKNLTLSLLDEQGQPAPSWFKLLTPAALGDLAVGAQAAIQVAAAPDSTVQPGDYYFNVRVEGDNASALQIPVLIAVTNSGTGSVFIHTTDIYTATLDENMEPIPGLGSVKVKLQNTDVLSEVFELTTDANGFGELDNIPAGRYSYRASAFDHESVSGHLWVKPGVTTQEQLFLMNKLINVEFSVTEITLEDRYDIVLKATYETNVPVPVVLFEPMSVNLPMLEKGEVFQGEFTITNHGLIEAYDVKANLPTGDDFARFDYLVDIPDTIQPGQVVRVPYRIVALQDFLPSGDGEATGGGCVKRNYKAVCTYSAECAIGTIIDNAATMIWNAISGSSCGGSGGGGGGGFYGGGYFGGGGGGGTNYSPAPPRQISVDDQFCPEDCEYCCGGGSGGPGGPGGGL